MWVRAEGRPGLDGRRLVPGRPPHPDAHRDLGPYAAARSRRTIIGRGQGRGRPGGPGAERDAGAAARRCAPDAHVRLAHPDTNGGIRILRRGYSFTDGTDGLGRLDAGLFFLAYQRDVREGFIPLQRQPRAHDAELNEYIQHVGSAVFAVPPGVRDRDDWWARQLFSDDN